MAGSDPSIYSLIQQQRPLPDPMEQYGKMMTLKNLMNQGQIQDQAMADDAATRTAWQQSEGNLEKFMQNPNVGYKSAKDAMTFQTEQKGKQAEIKSKDISMLKEIRVQNTEASKILLANFTPEGYAAYRENVGQQAQMFGSPEIRNEAMKFASMMPTDPAQGMKSLQAGLAKSETSTEFMRNAEAAGIKSGTPEFRSAWEKQQSGGRGEYFTPVQTAEGVKAFDARRGKIVEPSAKPVIGSASDPTLKGKMSAAEKFGGEIGKEVADVGRGADALTSISEARTMLDKGIYSGFYADIQKNIAKATPGADKVKAANTELYLSHIGNVVIPRLKDFGGSDTVEELKYLQNVMAGKITLEDKSIRGILDSVERKLKAKTERLSKQAGTVGLSRQADFGKPTGSNPSDLSDDDIRRELGL